MKTIAWGPGWPGLDLRDDAQAHQAALDNARTRVDRGTLEGAEGPSETAVPGSPVTGVWYHQAADGTVTPYCAAGASIWRWSGTAWVALLTPGGAVADIGAGEVRAVQIGQQTFIAKVAD